jgi:hypothetical protein
MKYARFKHVCWLLCICSVFAPEAFATDATPAPVAAKPDDDNWPDISGFIDQAYGFVPLLAPITEPAVGLGAVGALVFIDKHKGESEAGFGRPNISVIGALGTENGTRGTFAGDMRYWLDDRVKTLVGVVQASVNLDFYGIGRDPLLHNNPKSYNLQTTAAMAQGMYRIDNSQTWVGLGYVLASTAVRFNALPALESLPDFQSESRVGGLLPTVSFDSRDNMFTPTAGNYLNLSAGLFSKALGSDSDFRRVNLTGIHYRPLARHWTLGVMGSSTLSSGDVPFYLRPFISLRGAPAMRYQGDYTAQIEGELRWQFWERLSLIGFAGAGATRNEHWQSRSAQTVNTRGFGFRYEIARKQGLHMGFDIAHGPDGQAFYVQFGSAWMRP